MYCSNCEKESNLTLCKQCQKEFQAIEDEMSGKNLWDELDYESGEIYYDEEWHAQQMEDEKWRLYDLERVDSWYEDNVC